MPKRCQRRRVGSLGSPVRRPVPPFHRQDAEPVADADAVQLEGPRERRRGRRVERLVELERRPEGAEVLAEGAGRLERGDARIRRRAHETGIKRIFVICPLLRASFAAIVQLAECDAFSGPQLSGVSQRIAEQKPLIS